MSLSKRAAASRARIRFTPTERGAKVLEVVFGRYGSMKQFARAAGVDEDTVKRVCESDDPIDMRQSKIDGFVRAGVPRELLPLPVAS